MDPMEGEVEENIGWGSLDDLDGEYEICICAQQLIDEVSCYTIKVPDREARPPLSYFLTRPVTPLINSLINGGKAKAKAKDISNFTPKNLTPFSVATPKEPCSSRYFALLNNHL